jgi:serine/threonine protein kinase
LKRFQKRTNKRWNEAELNDLLEPLLNALELLHGQNILHRDIAPDNIFLKDNGQSMLIDFGAARQIESEQTLSQNLLYKHGYSPIEHYSLSGKSQGGAWSDIYSLAAVVYELVTGQKVHPAPDRVNDNQMPSLKNCRPVGLSANFITSIDFALAIKGKDRPRSISEWRDCMKTGKLPTSSTGKNVQRPLIILGIASSITPWAKYGSIAGGLVIISGLIVWGAIELKNPPDANQASISQTVPPTSVVTLPPLPVVTPAPVSTQPQAQAIVVAPVSVQQSIPVAADSKPQVVDDKPEQAAIQSSKQDKLESPSPASIAPQKLKHSDANIHKKITYQDNGYDVKNNHAAQNKLKPSLPSTSDKKTNKLSGIAPPTETTNVLLERKN